MENQNQHRTDIEKLSVLLPYWLNHNNDHIRDQERWLKKAEKEGLIKVADELTMAIEHSKKTTRHIEQANLRQKKNLIPNPTPITGGWKILMTEIILCCTSKESLMSIEPIVL